MNQPTAIRLARTMIHQSSLCVMDFHDPEAWMPLGLIGAERIVNGVSASPHYVLYNRDEETLLIVHLVEGAKPEKANPYDYYYTRFSASVVYQGVRAGYEIQRAIPRVRYDCGSYVDLRAAFVPDPLLDRYVGELREERGDPSAVITVEEIASVVSQRYLESQTRTRSQSV